jgi:hypothetical protein
MKSDILSVSSVFEALSRKLSFFNPSKLDWFAIRLIHICYYFSAKVNSMALSMCIIVGGNVM